MLLPVIQQSVVALLLGLCHSLPVERLTEVIEEKAAVDPHHTLRVRDEYFAFQYVLQLHHPLGTAIRHRLPSQPQRSFNRFRKPKSFE
jgi:hypothetical protein